MLKKQSAEAMQSAQLFDAEADEAAGRNSQKTALWWRFVGKILGTELWEFPTAYMSMFGADAQQAHVRQGNAAQKLNYLSAEYEKGQQLEMVANQKKVCVYVS
jgi:hypothetical protein